MVWHHELHSTLQEELPVLPPSKRAGSPSSTPDRTDSRGSIVARDSEPTRSQATQTLVMPAELYAVAIQASILAWPMGTTALAGTTSVFHPFKIEENLPACNGPALRTYVIPPDGTSVALLIALRIHHHTLKTSKTCKPDGLMAILIGCPTSMSSSEKASNIHRIRLTATYSNFKSLEIQDFSWPSLPGWRPSLLRLQFHHSKSWNSTALGTPRQMCDSTHAPSRAPRPVQKGTCNPNLFAEGVPHVTARESLTSPSPTGHQKTT